MLVFSQNNWIQVELPIGLDPCWKQADCWMYAVMHSAAKVKGFSDTRAITIAEAIVNKRIYPGIKYGHVLEKEIRSISGE